MGVSTDAKLCYGIGFEEGFEFPWVDEKYEDDIEDWWMEVNDYVNPEFCPYTEAGEFKEGIDGDDPRVDVYHTHSYEWKEANPLPVDLVYHCSDGCTMYILAVKDTEIKSYRGDTTEIIPANLTVTDEQRITLLDFCKKYEIEAEEEPKWLLCSYWG